eukprot:m.143999 g.143999  ORF g.143999 m.143999 type:complete len:281 (+) comp52655_c0_seq1:83-925(+)
MVRVGFIHPDLGLGGAERLVVDAGIALQGKGYEVEMYTSFHDPNRCFKETADGTLPVHVRGDWIPRHIFGGGYALCAYLRMIYCAISMVFFSGQTFDVIICDQISACIPILRLGRARVIFYCHFPDQLLTGRESVAKRIYRAPLDWLERVTTGMAHLVMVNSNFTQRTFHATFPTLRTNPVVLYPSLNFTAFDQRGPSVDTIVPARAEHVFLSINRYERKKNLLLALEVSALSLFLSVCLCLSLSISSVLLGVCRAAQFAHCRRKRLFVRWRFPRYCWRV